MSDFVMLFGVLCGVVGLIVSAASLSIFFWAWRHGFYQKMDAIIDALKKIEALVEGTNKDAVPKTRLHRK